MLFTSLLFPQSQGLILASIVNALLLLLLLPLLLLFLLFVYLCFCIFTFTLINSVFKTSTYVNTTFGKRSQKNQHLYVSIVISVNDF